ncbi:hypothetical protein L1887_00472 [Cichorium endivia]|nr:hypothetical protein L1887_00472 [Cichorium endivia]
MMMMKENLGLGMTKDASYLIENVVKEVGLSMINDNVDDDDEEFTTEDEKQIESSINIVKNQRMHPAMYEDDNRVSSEAKRCCKAAMSVEPCTCSIRNLHTSSQTKRQRI